MELSPLFKVLIIISNYLHDVATAMLLSSAVIVWLLGRKADAEGPDARRWFASAYGVLTKVALYSIVWIVVGGIPRTIYFQQVEWNMADPSNKYLFAALMIKHAAMWIAVIAGGLMWMRMRKVARGIVSERADH
jgi:lysylphosphatidylglycerol synthetase-like protein (DUF2156 family)